MISKLRRRIIFILTLLLGTVYLTILISINIFNYTSNLGQARNQIRTLVSRVGVDAICEYPRTDLRLEDKEYCVVRIGDNEEPEIVSDYMENYSEKAILKYSENIVSQGRSGGSVYSLVYIVKSWKSRDCNVIIFMNNDFAVENSKSLVMFSIVVFVLGMAVLFVISILISKWLVSPAEKVLVTEKEFISNASHELKTPLTIISANADILREEYGDNRQLSYIRQETSKMNHLIGEMLTLVRMDNANTADVFSEFDLSGAMLDVVLPFESVAFENKLHFDFQIDDGLHMYGNQEQVKRVMSILLDNAMSYTPEGGSVKVEVSIRNKRIYMKVDNTGEAIAEQMQEKIFERFYRENESRESEAKEGESRHFGLGLSIASSIVNHYRGKISVKSKEGINTFLVVLPVMR